jgi:hypothetical protein
VLFSFTLALGRFRSRIGRASARSRHCLVGLARRARPDRAAPPDRPLPSCSQPARPAPFPLLVATPAPIAAPPARNRGRSTSYVTSSQPESGADDTGAMSAGRWGHLSRLTESPTRVEVTETTRCDATPRHRRRQSCAERSRTRRSCPSVASTSSTTSGSVCLSRCLMSRKPPAARLLSHLPGPIQRSERVAHSCAPGCSPPRADRWRTEMQNARPAGAIARIRYAARTRPCAAGSISAIGLSVWSLTSTSPNAIG